ncbi:MAG: hypothetical protein AAGF96_12050 [Bacteroidota bacterium]
MSIIKYTTHAKACLLQAGIRAVAGVIWEKVNYVHQNPVEAGLVFKAEDYVYSSAIDYAGEQGLLENIVVFEYH